MNEPSKHSRKRWSSCTVEEEFFGEERKKGKKQRKHAIATDRSKYKKTDQDKIVKRAKDKEQEKEEHLRGRVLSVMSQGISVDCEGKIITCALKGILKKDKTQLKNLVTVGDWVRLEEICPGEGQIYSVEPRQSVLSRADNLSRRKQQLIAANIDQVLITVSVVSPPLKPFIVDRYIIATQMGRMIPIIVVNKIDLFEDSTFDNSLRAEEKVLYDEFISAYRKAGLRVIGVSAATGEGIDDLRREMQGKASVFSGQSGVGKSSLITAVTGMALLVGPIVGKTQKGTHTTSAASFLQLPSGGWCIDTPGIRSFGVWNLNKEDIEAYFTEIYACGRKCKYPDCSHLHEQECAVIRAIEAGEISLLRYRSYQYLIESLHERHLRR